MEQLMAKFRESMDALLADINGRAEEVKENFSSFREVFGKELEIQADNLKVHRERLEVKGKKIFNAKEFSADVREEIEMAVSDLRTAVDKFFDALKSGIEKAK